MYLKGRMCLLSMSDYLTVSGAQFLLLRAVSMECQGLSLDKQS